MHYSAADEIAEQRARDHVAGPVLIGVYALPTHERGRADPEYANPGLV